MTQNGRIGPKHSIPVFSDPRGKKPCQCFRARILIIVHQKLGHPEIVTKTNPEIVGPYPLGPSRYTNVFDESKINCIR